MILFPKRRLKKFLDSDRKNWEKFDKDLDSPRFRKAVQSSSISDEKLKAYVSRFGEYRSSGNVIAEVPSKNASGKYYQIKKLPSGGVGCGCGDWHYKHSIQGTDCVHIQKAKKMKLLK